MFSSLFSNFFLRIKRLKRKTKIKLLILLSLLIWFYFCLPQKLFLSPTSYVIEDAEGNLLNASIAEDGQWRFPFNEVVPEKFEKCILAFEDKRFYYHPGVDPIALGRAFKQNTGSGKRVSGGSTITMQVIRLSRNGRKRNMYQKMIECILAVRLECRYSKKKILALYASNAPFGSNVVGLDAAAWRYFGRSAEQLSWGEMSALSVLPNAPTLVRPGKNQNELLRKRNIVLDRLLEEGTIDKITCDLAKLEPLPAAPYALPQFAPHLLQRFKNDYKKLELDYTKTRTTLDFALQKQVTQIVNSHHNTLKGNGINNACAMVLDVETGNAIAYVGNVYNVANPELESHVDVLSKPRSPGSTLKPMLYASMLSDGVLMPHQLVPDIPTQIGGYTPQNFNLEYDGVVPANRALARSLNIPAIRMLKEYKYQRFYDVLKQAGISSLTKPADHYGLSLILGGCEVTAWEMAGMYASMARIYNHQQQWQAEYFTGDLHPPVYIPNAYRTFEKEGRTQNVGLVDRTALWQMFEAMNEVMRPGEEGLWQQFNSSQKIAWKTGTSFGFRDGWAIGITPKNVVVVWCGNADGEGRPALTGINTAAPILFDIFRQLPNAGWFKSPMYATQKVAVCHESGFRPTIDCKNIDTVIIGISKSNAPLCPYHKLIHLDATGQWQVNEQCESPSKMQNRSWFSLPPTIAYYYQQKHADYKPLPAFKQGCQNVEGKQMELVYPEPNSKLYVPIELNGEKGKIVFTATHSNPNAVIHWHLDEAFVTSTIRFHQLGLSPAPGEHSIAITDDKGETITRRFIILSK